MTAGKALTWRAADHADSFGTRHEVTVTDVDARYVLVLHPDGTGQGMSRSRIVETEAP